MVDPREKSTTNVQVQVLLAELKACSKTRNLRRGKQIHAQATKCRHDSNIYVASTLINMYAKCGSLVDAHQVFNSIMHPNVVSWTILILGYAENGQGLVALDLYTRMISEGTVPNSVTLVAALKACISLISNEAGARKCRHWGKQIYDFSVANGLESDVYVQSTLINMYSRCGSMVEARQVFDSSKCPNVVSWTALILGYADNGQGLSALDLFINMRSVGPEPNSLTFMAALKACTSLNCSKQMHNLVLECGCDSDIYIQNTLIAMYARNESLIDARLVFDNMKCPDVVSWTVLILGYADHGSVDALELFTKMKCGGPVPDSVTLVAALKACTSLAMKGAENRDRGKQVHVLAVEFGCDLDLHVRSTLIDMYAKCGSMSYARQVFDSIKHPDVVSWTVLILGYVENGQGLAALDLLTRMRCTGPAPDSVTFGAALKVCTFLGALEFGRTLHSEMESWNHVDLILVNCLVDFYAKCGSLAEAQSVFLLYAETRDVITYTALMAGFSNLGDHKSVFGLLQSMQDAGFEPNSVTLISILMCCSHAGLVEKGKECFDTMYTRFGIIPTIEHYNCMTDILGRANKFDDVMALLQHMRCRPDDVTWMTILSACRKWKNVEIGRLAFLSLSNWDIAAYVLIGQIYGSVGMLQEQEIVNAKAKERLVDCDQPRFACKL